MIITRPTVSFCTQETTTRWHSTHVDVDCTKHLYPIYQVQTPTRIYRPWYTRYPVKPTSTPSNRSSRPTRHGTSITSCPPTRKLIEQMLPQLNGCPLNSSNFKIADDIYGPNFGAMKGKTIRCPNPHINARSYPVPSNIIAAHLVLVLKINISLSTEMRHQGIKGSHETEETATATTRPRWILLDARISRASGPQQW